VVCAAHATLELDVTVVVTILVTGLSIAALGFSIVDSTRAASSLQEDLYRQLW
jgi:hypothetical protein